jgi:hypothetical protein
MQTIFDGVPVPIRDAGEALDAALAAFMPATED